MSSTKKPYCKVCHDAGKSESEYTNHWVKDLTGKTTCPTLLNLECRYCFKLGHTVKFCNVLAKNNKEKEKAERRTKSQDVAEKPVVQKKATNGFAALCDDSDSEEEVEYPILEPKVTTSWAAITAEPKATTSWAAIAAKPMEVKAPVVDNTGIVFLSIKNSVEKPVEKQIKKPVEQPKLAPWATKPISNKSWADWSDSEDEDQDEEQGYELQEEEW
jgi:hypothetical protein